MRRIVVSLLVAGLVIGLLALPAIAVQGSFRAVIHETFERRASAEPCAFEEATETLTCPGWGNVAGYGRVTSSVVFSATGTTRTLTFKDGSTLVLAETWGTEPTRFPGNSFNAPGALVSYGNPAFDAGTWTVIGGTGTFAGATGSGTVENVLAGDAITLRYVGEITWS